MVSMEKLLKATDELNQATLERAEAAEELVELQALYIADLESQLAMYRRSQQGRGTILPQEVTSG